MNSRRVPDGEGEKVMRPRLCTAALAAALAAAPAHALTYAGFLDFEAPVLPVGMSLEQATGLNFVGLDGVDNGAAPGALAGVTQINMSCAGECGSTYDIASFAAFAGGPLLQLTGGLTFTLDAPLTVTGRSAAETGTGAADLTVSGTGFFSSFAYDPTPATFSLIVRDVPEGRSLVARGTARPLSPVPEPASWALMLMGFAAVGSAIRHGRPVHGRSPA